MFPWWLLLLMFPWWLLLLMFPWWLWLMFAWWFWLMFPWWFWLMFRWWFWLMFHGDFDWCFHGDFDWCFHADFDWCFRGDFDWCFHADFDWCFHADFDWCFHADFDWCFHGDFDWCFHGDFDWCFHGDFDWYFHGDFDWCFHGDFDRCFHGDFDRCYDWAQTTVRMTIRSSSLTGSGWRGIRSRLEDLGRSPTPSSGSREVSRRWTWTTRSSRCYLRYALSVEVMIRKTIVCICMIFIHWRLFGKRATCFSDKKYDIFIIKSLWRFLDFPERGLQFQKGSVSLLLGHFLSKAKILAWRNAR